MNKKLITETLFIAKEHFASGEWIKRVQTVSECSICIASSDNPKFFSLVIKGYMANIIKARDLINNVIYFKRLPQTPICTANQIRKPKIIDIYIPPHKCGLIIGKQGDTIRQLQKQSGCKMVMIQTSQEVTGMAKPLRVWGEPEKVEVAKRLVANVVLKNENLDYFNNALGKKQTVVYMYVQSNKAGLVIGKGGETIKHINRESGAYCELSRDTPRNWKEKVFMIKGNQQQIRHAQHLIRIKIGDIPPHVPVPIFREAQIQEASSGFLQSGFSYVPDPETLDVVKPLMWKNYCAYLKLKKKYCKDVKSRVSGSDGNKKDPSNNIHPLTKGEVMVPRSRVSVIIGTNGNMIKKLSIKTGAKIHFKPDDDSNSADRCVVIMGNSDQVCRATTLITCLIKSNIGRATQT